MVSRRWPALGAGLTPLPFSRCARGGLGYARASDPVVAVGPDGTAYTSSLSFTPNNTAPSFTTADAIAAATSRGGGRSWENLRVLDRDTNRDTQGFLDKEWVTADPTRPGTAYLVWDHWAPAGDGFRVPARFSRTTDGGRTWSPWVTPVPAGTNEYAAIDQVLVDPRTHTLYLVFVHYAPGQPTRLALVRSSDGGRSWSAVASINRIVAPIVRDPYTHRDLRTADSLYSAALDPLTRQLSIAWQDSRFTGGRYAEGVYTSTRDGGRTWSPLRVVTSRTGHPAFLPTIATNAARQVGLLYYDFRRDDPGTPVLTTDIWFRTVESRGAALSVDQHVAGPFNFATAPFAGGRFLGDYQGLVAAGGAFTGFFAAANCLGSCPANRTDIYSATMRPVPATLASPRLAEPTSVPDAATTAPASPLPVRRGTR